MNVFISLWTCYELFMEPKYSHNRYELYIAWWNRTKVSSSLQTADIIYLYLTFIFNIIDFNNSYYTFFSKFSASRGCWSKRCTLNLAKFDDYYIEHFDVFNGKSNLFQRRLSNYQSYMIAEYTWTWSYTAKDSTN